MKQTTSPQCGFEGIFSQFKPSFFLFDVSLNDSVIRRINLARPRLRIRVRGGGTGQTLSQNTVCLCPDNLASCRSNVGGEKSSLGGVQGMAPNDNENADKNHMAAEVKALDAVTPPVLPAPYSVNRPVGRSQECYREKIKEERYDLFASVSQDSGKHLTFVSVTKSSQWEIFDSTTNSKIALAARAGGIGASTIKVFSALENTNRPIAWIRSNLARSAFWAETTVDGGKKELAAILFKSSKRNECNIRQFTVFIPKPDLAFDEQFGKKQARMKLKPKRPKMKNGIPFLCFGGRVKMQSVKNHILVNADIEDGENIFVFGKAADSVFVCDVFAPMSAIQAICLGLPHLK
jgi:hypothetical protein